MERQSLASYRGLAPDEQLEEVSSPAGRPIRPLKDPGLREEIGQSGRAHVRRNPLTTASRSTTFASSPACSTLGAISHQRG